MLDFFPVHRLQQLDKQKNYYQTDDKDASFCSAQRALSRVCLAVNWPVGQFTTFAAHRQ